MVRRVRVGRAAGLALVAMAAAAAVVLIAARPSTPQKPALVRGNAPGEWRYWGADAWSTRYSALDQINA